MLPARLRPVSAATPTRRWVAAWLLASALGSAFWIQRDIGHQQADFETQARIAHRLLSQRAVEHEAILRTLSLTQAPASALLSSVYSRVLSVQQRRAGAEWPDARLRDAEAGAAGAPQPILAWSDLANGRFALLIPARSAGQAAYALEISAPLMVDPADWPFAAPDAPRDTLLLRHAGEQGVLQEAPGRDALHHFVFAKRLAAESQPFELVARRSLRGQDLPWAELLLLTALIGLATLAARAASRQRQAARRSAELLRLGQIARINALGEFAAGLAHELNQPLTALVANAQAARRLLDEAPPDPAGARAAAIAASEQGRRAAAVVARLRQRIEASDRAALIETFDLAALIRRVARLVGPDCERDGIALRLAVPEVLPAHADATATEQILHNLLGNARQALRNDRPHDERLVQIEAARDAKTVQVTVSDNGAGVPVEVQARLFEPFVTGRGAAGGLGLGLSLSHTLAEESGGALAHARSADGWTRFTLSLPAADAPP